VIEVGGQAVTFEQEKVRAIYFGPAPEQPAKTSDRDDAIKALKALQSVATGGTDYRNYAPRVSDAKIAVDRYLSSETPDPQEAKAAIQKSMGFYSLASAAWNSKISRSNYEAVSSNPLLDECPPLNRELNNPQFKARNDMERSIHRAVTAQFSISEIWSCASQKLSEAESLLKAAR
jgi:uncharacterized protein with von Willebrand factor type A (vWA) domain